MKSLGEALHLAANVSWAYEISSTKGGTLSNPNWYPGCGFEAKQQVISCEWCAELYKAANIETKQGHDCDAWSFYENGAWFLTGGYYSCIDLTVFRFAMGAYPYGDGAVKPLPDEAAAHMKIEPICDRCVRKLIDEGKIVEVGERGLA